MQQQTNKQKREKKGNNKTSKTKKETQPTQHNPATTKLNTLTSVWGFDICVSSFCFTMLCCLRRTQLLCIRNNRKTSTTNRKQNNKNGSATDIKQYEKHTTHDKIAKRR